MSDEHATVAGVRLTHPDKALAEGVTKRELAEHFARVAERMLPEVADRPLTLVRCPGGIDDGCFYQKHADPSGPEAIGRVRVREKDGAADYYRVSDTEGLVALAQIAALEVHITGHRADEPTRPDRMVFDLDPGPGTGFDDVVAAAREVRDRLEELELASHPLLTGGSGIHVVVPLERRHEYGEVRAFSRALARRLADDEPGRYVAKADKDLREGKIFVDYLRNGAGATCIAPYSTRAKPDLPVAVPVRWDELGSLSRSAAYPMKKLPRRLASLGGDPWGDDARGSRQRIGRDAMRALGVEEG